MPSVLVLLFRCCGQRSTQSKPRSLWLSHRGQAADLYNTLTLDTAAPMYGMAWIPTVSRASFDVQLHSGPKPSQYQDCPKCLLNSRSRSRIDRRWGLTCIPLAWSCYKIKIGLIQARSAARSRVGIRKAESIYTAGFQLMYGSDRGDTS